LPSIEKLLAKIHYSNISNAMMNNCSRMHTHKHSTISKVNMIIEGKNKYRSQMRKIGNLTGINDIL
jgi:hypothetical protein